MRRVADAYLNHRSGCSVYLNFKSKSDRYRNAIKQHKAVIFPTLRLQAGFRARAGKCDCFAAGQLPISSRSTCALLHTLVFWLKLRHHVHGKNELDSNLHLPIYYIFRFGSARLGFTGCPIQELMPRLDQQQESDAIQTATLQES